MYGKPAAIHIICLVAQEVEKLRIHHGDNENEYVVRVGDNDKEGGFPVPPPDRPKTSIFVDAQPVFYMKNARYIPYEISI